MIAFDAGNEADAISHLDRCVAIQKSMASSAGLVCALYGRGQDCVRYLSLADSNDARWLLLEGNAALRAGDAEKAKGLFNLAIANADSAALRRFALERLVAAHRRQKTLGALADGWLSDRSLPRECWIPLAIVLRETGRIDDLLAFWKRVSTDADGSADPLLQSLATEVVNAARYAGKTEQAKAICLHVLANHPDGNDWLKFTARALCDWGDSSAAAELLDHKIDQTTDATQLQRLAQIGRDLGLREAAMAAGAKLSAQSPDASIEGLLLRADIAGRFADFAARDDYLTQAASAARSHPADADRVAGALEFADRIDDAIALLQHTSSTGGYDQNLRLAALLAKQGRFAESAGQYEQLRSVAPTQAQRAQASIALLDNAAAARALPKLIADLQAKIQKGDGTPDDVLLLANAMVRAGEPKEADSLLRATSLLDEKSRLNQLAILLLRLHHGAEAQAVLRRLVTIDPDGAVDHLEEIASTALAGKDAATANAAIAEIRQRLGNVPASTQLLGNIFDRLGRPADAADCYQRTLAADPENGDAWLLWSAAMSKAGMTLIARQRLQLLAHEADNDALFVTAVDGILNQKPPPFVTQSLRRGAIVRLADHPQSVLLWHVVTDLSDELNDSAFSRRSIECALPFNDDERDQRLRDLLAATENHPDQSDAAIEVGHCMELLGDRFPPQDFINLGDQLLDAHRPQDALAMLRRAVQETNADRVTMRIVDLLAKFNLFSDALNVALPLAPRHASDADFQLDFAQINEAAGNTAAALHSYELALGIYIDQLASHAGGDANDGQPDTIAASVLGAIGCVRSPADADGLLAILSNHQIRSPDTSIPRILAIVRQIAFALHQPEAAEKVENADASASMVTSGVASRLDTGLFAAAKAFAAAHHADAALPVGAKWAGQFFADVKHDENSFPGDPAYLALKIRGALAINDVQQAVSIARSFPPNQIGADTNLLGLLCRAAILGNDNHLADRFALDSASRILNPPAESLPGSARPGMLSMSVPNQMSNDWCYLDDQGRLDLQTLVEESLKKTSDPAKRQAEAKLLLTIAAINGRPTENGASLALSLIDPKRPDAKSTAHLCLLLPPSQQAIFLRAMSADTRLAIDLDVLEQSSVPLSAPTMQVIEKGISQLPTQSRLPWNAWCCNPVQATQLGGVADALGAIIPQPGLSLQSIGPTVACALALCESGRSADADVKAHLAVEHLKSWQPDQTMVNKDYFAYEQLKPGDPPPRPYLLQAALSAMSGASRQALDSELMRSDGSAQEQSRSSLSAPELAWDMDFRAMVKQSIGDQRAAMALLARSFALYPLDPSVRKLYSEWLFHQGYDQALLQSFTDVFTGAQGDRRVLGFVLRSARHLYRTGNDYHRSDVADEVELPNLMLPAAEGDSTAVEQAFDRLVQILRTPRSTRNPASALDDPPLGGLQGAPSQRSLEMLSASQSAMRTLLANWSAKPVREAPWAQHLLSLGLAAGAIDRAPMLNLLASRAAESSLNDADRDLLSILVGDSNTLVSPVLRDDAWQAAAMQPSDKRFDLVGELADRGAAATQPATRPSGVDRATAPRQQWQVPHAPVLNGSLPDQWSATVLQSHIAAGKFVAANDELHTMIQADCIPSQSALTHVAAARIAAELGDLPTMQLRVRAAIEAWKSRPPPSVISAEDTPPPALEDVTPASFASPQSAAAFSEAMQSEIERAINRWPADSELVAALAKVGGRLQQEGYITEAKSFLDIGMRDNTNLCDGDQTLSLADLAQRLDDGALSQKLQLQCLHSGCLPVGRIKPLLNGVEPSLRARLLQFVPSNLPAPLVQ